MKIILLSGFFFLFFVNIFAEKTITCKLTEEIYQQDCQFSRVTIGPNEAVSVKTDPSYANPITIEKVRIIDSSIHSVPSEIFTKFPNLRKFLASGQNIQEVKADTFANGKKLEEISLDNNALTILHADTFKGKNLQFSYS
jgi:Leucine-rich repeat (LRR) protein